MVALLALCTLIVGAAAWLVHVRFRIGPAIGPGSTGLFVLMSIFGLRPLFLQGNPAPELFGLYVRDGYALAAMAGLVAVSAYAVGLLCPARRVKSGSSQLSSWVQTPGAFVRAVVASWALIAAWFATIAHFGGGFEFLRELFGGRSADVAERLTGLPNFVWTMPVAAILVVGVAYRHRRRAQPAVTQERLLLLFTLTLSILPPLSLGNRRFLVPALLIAVAAVLEPRWNRRLSAFHAALLLAVLIALAATPFVRSAGSRADDENLAQALSAYVVEEGPTSIVHGYFTSYDTEMFDHIAYVGPRLGDEIPYGFGRGTIGDVLLAPFPASLTPWTPWSDQILTAMYGTGCDVSGTCPVASSAGIFFYDFGLAGVLLGMFLLGRAAVWVERSAAGQSGVREVVALGLLGFWPVLIRGNVANLAWIAANAVITGLVVALLVMPQRKRVPQDVLHGGASPGSDVVAPGLRDRGTR